MKIILKNVRCGFVHSKFTSIFEPIKNMNGKPSYGCQLYIEPNDPQIKKLMATVTETAKQEWGNEWQEILNEIRPDKRAFCIKKSKAPAVAGWIEISARAGEGHPPTVLKSDARTKATPADIYSGCRVNVLLNLYVSKNGGNGLRAGLSHVAFAGHDSRLDGGGVPATEVEIAELATTPVDVPLDTGIDFSGGMNPEEEFDFT